MDQQSLSRLQLGSPRNTQSRLLTRRTKYKSQHINDSSSQTINLSIFKRFETFLLNQKIINLSNVLKSHYGRHHPIEYRPQYGFSEYWQDKKFNKQYEQLNTLQFFQYPHWYYYVMAFAVLGFKLFIIWNISIYRLFQFHMKEQFYVPIVAIIIILFDILLQFLLLKHYSYFNGKTIFSLFEVFWKEIILLGYFIGFSFHYERYDSLLYVLDFVIVYLLYQRCVQINKCFKIELLATKYKNMYNIIELFSTLLPIAHIFALSLFSVTYMDPQNNWLKIVIESSSPNTDFTSLVKYIYSLYFTLTTMLTVGYGDIHPVNVPEILVIIVIQMVGIVTYGYIVNEIGHIISHVRKEQEVLAQDISTISKMAKYYDLDEVLVEKAKNFLMCKKQQQNNFTTEQEKQTLSKLHDDLRQEISHENSLRILKSSMFYVCNWTKRFQLQIAKKIHKKIFSPNEQIFQIPGKERIYVFKKGKVQILANRASGYKKYFKKILRTIQANESLQVSDNIYGYSFIMSNTPIKLSAINRQFVVAYYVEKSTFLQTVMDNHLDIEYFHQMKTKIDLTPSPEAWEAPLIANTKEHYLPSIQFLIKKNKTINQEQRNLRTSRLQARRYRSRRSRVYYQSLQQLQGQLSPENNIRHDMQQTYKNQAQINDKIKSQSDDYLPSAKTLVNLHNSTTWISAQIKQNNQNEFRKENLHCIFQQGRQYSIYFKRSNKNNVLEKMENSNYMLHTKSQKNI